MFLCYALSSCFYAVFKAVAVWKIFVEMCLLPREFFANIDIILVIMVTPVAHCSKRNKTLIHGENEIKPVIDHF